MTAQDFIDAINKAASKKGLSPSQVNIDWVYMGAADKNIDGVAIEEIRIDENNMKIFLVYET